MIGLAWFEDTIRAVLPNLPLSEEQVVLLHRHYELLCRWNQRMDLTSLQRPEEIVRRHYCESLFFGNCMPETAPVSVVDFGSGAGFPGFPLAVLHPEWRVTLLEAHQRRAVFLKQVARGIENITVVASRGELFHVKHQWLVARAVKVTDVIANASRIAKKVGVLVGQNAVEVLLERSGYEWSEPILIPGSVGRFCVFGGST